MHITLKSKSVTDRIIQLANVLDISSIHVSTEDMERLKEEGHKRLSNSCIVLKAEDNEQLSYDIVVYLDTDQDDIQELTISLY